MVDFSKAHFCFLRSSWLGNRIFVSLGKSLFVFWQATRTRTKQPEPNKRNGSYLNAKRRSIFGSSNNVSPWWYFFANVCGMGSGGYRCQDECSNLVFRDGSQSPVVFFFFASETGRRTPKPCKRKNLNLVCHWLIPRYLWDNGFADLLLVDFC